MASGRKPPAGIVTHPMEVGRHALDLGDGGQVAVRRRLGGLLNFHRRKAGSAAPAVVGVVQLGAWEER